MRRTARHIVGNAGPGDVALPNVVERRSRVNRPGRHGRHIERSPGKGGKDMALKQIVGLDHIVVLVRDLDGAAETWRRLGFTLAPRGTYSPHMGTGNYTIMLDADYLELIGVLTETAHNAPSRA